MTPVALSGGDFGGEVVDMADDQDEVLMTSEDGSTWLYSRASVQGRKQAVLVQYTPPQG